MRVLRQKNFKLVLYDSDTYALTKVTRTQEKQLRNGGIKAKRHTLPDNYKDVNETFKREVRSNEDIIEITQDIKILFWKQISLAIIFVGDDFYITFELFRFDSVMPVQNGQLLCLVDIDVLDMEYPLNLYKINGISFKAFKRKLLLEPSSLDGIYSKVYENSVTAINIKSKVGCSVTINEVLDCDECI